MTGAFPRGLCTSMDELLEDFLAETTENLETVDNELVRFEQTPDDTEVLSNIFRLVHTVKGSCGFIGLPRLETLAHAAETLLGKVRDGELTVRPDIVTETLNAIDGIKKIIAGLSQTGKEPSGNDAALIARLEACAATDSNVSKSATAGNEHSGAAAGSETADEAAPEAEKASPNADPAAGAAGNAPTQSIRVSVELLEQLMTGVSELVLTRNQLMQESRADDGELGAVLQRLSNQVGHLQEAVMRTRMQPVSNAWNVLPRIVRTLSLELGKKIDLVMVGDETELDRQMLELIKDPLSHMVRNAADHGVETPDERAEVGKSETGTIHLSAAQEGGHIVITLADDGRGIDTAALRKKAVSQNLMSAAEAKSAPDAQICRLIFAAGLSTATQVTQISGRGVGMDVVRANIEKIGGNIEVESQAGEGTRFTVRIPLTLAIMPALIVGVGEQRFAVPQMAVVELVRTGGDSDHKIERIGGAAVLRLRGKLLPLVHLSALLGRSDVEEGDYVLVTRAGSAIFGIVVSEIFDTEEIVVKPVAAPLVEAGVYSGNAILGNGRVIMILDVSGIAAKAIDTAPEEETAEEALQDVAADAGERDAMLVFRAGSPHPKAVPLSLVARLEEFPVEDIEWLNGRAMIQLREALVPMQSVEGEYEIPSEGRQTALLFSNGGHLVALCVDEVIDIVEDRIELQIASDNPAKLGTAVIGGRATELLDISHFINLGSPRAETGLAAPQSDRPSILVIDDSPFFRNMLKPLLDAAGYRVTAVASADEALKLREDGKSYDIILSDIEMPGKSGLDFARAVRQGGKWSETPLVALSSQSTEDDMDAGMNAGFDRYVAKFDRQRLLGLLAGELKGRAA